MTYNLSPQEMEKIRSLIQILTNAADGHSDELFHFASIESERAAVELAWDVERILS